MSSVHLVIDTATAYLYIALFDSENKLIEEVYEEGNNDHSVKLMKRLKQCFSKHDLKPSQIAKITVGIGPGSYTGVRVGVVVAKMLAWTLEVPIFKVSSLALLASGADQTGHVLAWMDARRGNGFYGRYEVSEDSVQIVDADKYGEMARVREKYNYDFELVMAKPRVIKVLKSELVERVENVHELSPVYLRETEAEQALKDQ